MPWISFREGGQVQCEMDFSATVIEMFCPVESLVNVRRLACGKIAKLAP